MSPVAVGELYDYTIEFYPQDDVFPAGSDLVLTLDTKDSRFGLAAGAGGVRVDGAGRPAAFEIDLAESALVLPRIDSATRVLEDPQPTPIVCFACH